MVGLWILLVMLCLLIATGSALLALRLQYRAIDQTRQEREAWQQAQESRQRTWEVRQGKHILEAEKKLADQLKDARREWRAWSVQLEQNQLDWQERADIEKEVARLPHIEHLELPQNAASRHQRPENWRPPMLYRANLSGRDLSYRYMERADLREADLTEANLYMADLTGASLAGANLERANLTGANLSGADLRGANLANVSLLVTDLHNAVLHGAVLLGARHLSTQQLQEAIYDSTTVIDSAIDITLPRIPGVQVTPADLLSIVQAKQAGAESPISPPSEQLNEAEPAEKAVREEAVPVEIEPANQSAPAEAHEELLPVTQTGESITVEIPLTMPVEQKAQEPATSGEAEAEPQIHEPAIASSLVSASEATDSEDSQERGESARSSSAVIEPEVANGENAQETGEPAIASSPVIEPATPDSGDSQEIVIAQETGEGVAESGASEVWDESKIIRLSTRAAKASQKQSAQKRPGSSSAKRGGRKSKAALEHEKSS